MIYLTVFGPVTEHTWEKADKSAKGVMYLQEAYLWRPDRPHPRPFNLSVPDAHSALDPEKFYTFSGDSFTSVQDRLSLAPYDLRLVEVPQSYVDYLKNNFGAGSAEPSLSSRAMSALNSSVTGEGKTK